MIWGTKTGKNAFREPFEKSVDFLVRTNPAKILLGLAPEPKRAKYLDAGLWPAECAGPKSIALR